MAKRLPFRTDSPVERAFLVGAELSNARELLSLEDSLSELRLLAQTAGAEVVGQATQALEKPNADTYIGSGKVEEIRILIEETMADLVIFDVNLSPRHQRELERIFGNSVRVIDRTALILDIFAQHAHTREGSLQVELAQYEYRLPRLTRAWTHLVRQAGGGGGRTGNVGGVGLRGPGETQLEVDRREVRKRISHLKVEIEKIRSHRMRYRAQRKHSNIPVVALVGYTNAGKSTLLNALARTDIYVANQLFATLDPTTRRVSLPNGHIVLMTDTVGFIQKLPTELVAAFRATLEEIAESDLLIHVVDITHPNAKAQTESVFQTLEQINADHIPIITALNKIDRLSDLEAAQEVVKGFENSFAISAQKGAGIPELLSAVEETLFEKYEHMVVQLPYQEGQLVSLFHEYGRVERIEQIRGGTIIEGKIPGRLSARFSPFIK